MFTMQTKAGGRSPRFNPTFRYHIRQLLDHVCEDLRGDLFGIGEVYLDDLYRAVGS